ncbi:MAG: MFS transporter [Calditrichaeota bacterium]|nr:MAG: MFS transporter [Calditrichota bacterium]
MRLVGYDSQIPLNSRYSFNYYSRSYVLIAIYFSFASIFEIVLTKSFQATPQQLSIIFTLATSANLISIFALRKVSSASRLKVLLVTISLGALSYCLLATTYFYKVAFFAITIMSIHYFANPVYLLCNTSFLREIYDKKFRGRLFSVTQSIGFLVSIVVSLTIPPLLDFYPNSYVFFFPIVGALAFFGIFRLQRMKLKPTAWKVREREPVFKTLFSVLNPREPFFYFEMFFMVYGFGFLMNLPVQLTFFEQELNLNYTDFGIAWILIPNLLLASLSFGFGRFFDRFDPFRVASIFFLILAFFNLFLYFSQNLTDVFIAKGIYGIAMSGVNLAWNLGPLYFAHDSESPERYISAHIFLTGVRGLVAPQLGISVADAFGLRETFFVCFLVLLVASLGMFVAYRKFVFQKEKQII